MPNILSGPLRQIRDSGETSGFTKQLRELLDLPDQVVRFHAMFSSADLRRTI